MGYIGMALMAERKECFCQAIKMSKALKYLYAKIDSLRLRTSASCLKLSLTRSFKSPQQVKRKTLQILIRELDLGEIISPPRKDTTEKAFHSQRSLKCN